MATPVKSMITTCKISMMATSMRRQDINDGNKYAAVTENMKNKLRSKIK